jgi:hypothetical protein
MGPKEAADATAQAAAILTQALKDAKDPNAMSALAEGLSALAARMGPKEAADATAQAAAILTQALKNTKNPNAVFWRSLVIGGPVPGHLKDTKGPRAVSRLARGLSALAARMEPKEAADATALAAASLTQALKNTKDPNAVSALAQGLSALAARMEPKEAAQAAAILTQALKDAKDALAVFWLAQGLSAVAARMEPKEAAQAAAILTQALKDTKNPNSVSALAWALSAVTARIEPKEAATTLFRVMADQSDLRNLTLLMSTTTGQRGPLRATAVTVAGVGHLLTTLPVLIAAAEPLPCRLSTQQLVELLKFPACVGDKRRLVLDCLGQCYQRRFADLWDFVAWAKEHEPDLDLTTPPKRPGR